ncbi:MAG: translocation/assembly module TamB domain-containing protein, partial [Chryseolinea sp.]
STLVTELSLNIKNDKKVIAEYYATKNKTPKSYQANIKVNLKNIEPIVNLLNIDLIVSPNTLFEGRFVSGYTTILQGYSNIKSISYQGNTFTQSDVEFTTSKIADSTSILSMAVVNSEKQSFGTSLKTKNLLAEAIWNNSHIDISLDADQDGQYNNVRLKGSVDFLKDSTTIILQPSKLSLLERDWNFSEDNFITLIGKEVKVHHLSLENKNQSIAVDGQLSSDPSKILSLAINQLDLATLNVLTDKKISGILNADIRLNNYYKIPSVENDIQISNLTVNDFLIGDVTGKNKWDTLTHKFDINVMIDRMQLRTVNIVGHYDPSHKKSPLDLIASLEKANLKLIEPFMKGIFSQIGGTVSGDFTLKGQLDAPEINGEGKVSDGQLMVDYLKTMYQFTGHIGLTPNSIYFKDIEMNDAFRHKGKLNGAIHHKNFNSMTINLKADFQNFQVLNTTTKDNSLFFGQAYATGDVNFNGPISNLSITANARTEKNTRVYIPIGGTSDVETKDFINFVNFNDTTKSKEIDLALENKLNLTGLTFDLNLDVTPDAYCEIIIDLKAGDIIRGRGNGDLKLQLDTKGEFNMFGPFVFTEGFYNFTLYDIINKEFQITKGSKISWYGDPYQGILDINASYNQMASFAPIITDPTISSAPQLKRKYPAQVALKLEGPMLTPQINFDITAKDLPKNIQTDTRTVNLDFEFTAFKNKLDEQELKRQVFSLIILRRFSPPESFNTSGSVVNSVSELLSNQLSYWMSQMDQNLEINVDLGTMDQEAFNTFQLRFSYTFLNGRLRVTGDGTFNNGSQASASNPNPSTVAGDWTVDYMLTADGKLRIKMFNRTNVNPITSTTGNGQNVNTTGASVIYTQTFNRLKDIWRTNRKKKEEEDAKQNLNPNEEAIKEEDGGE